MTAEQRAKQRAKVWQLVDSISDIAIKVDIFAQEDIKRYPVNSQHLKTCRRVVERLMAIAADLETVGEPELK